MINKLYQAYYTNSSPITRYMVDQLDIRPNDYLFEPCAGDGAFIDEVVKRNIKISITAFELNPDAYKSLVDKYRNDNIEVFNEDTILFEENSLFSNSIMRYFDKIIANPPYGAWQDYSKRNDLKKRFPNLYVKETYGLFLYKCINLLKEGGKLTFIIPDTYMSLHNHKELRKIILTKTKINEIVKFPSSFFPGVNFGYAGLSIITLTKDSVLKNCLSNTFEVKTGFEKVENLPLGICTDVYAFTQNEILENKSHAFYLFHDNSIKEVFNNSDKTIGDIADCVTGIYTGNDKKFFRVTAKKKIKGADKFLTVNDNEILDDPKLFNLTGITRPNSFIPLQKSNGRTPFYSEPNWYINWNSEIVKHYNNDKKARFQNSSYYFKDGIALPMVKTSQTHAFKLDGYLFDQSIVGIFPKQKEDLFYLLAFLNSNLFKTLINTINPSANNSANYVKKTPLPKISTLDKSEVIEISKELYEAGKNGEKLNSKLKERIDLIFEKERQPSAVLATG